MLKNVPDNSTVVGILAACERIMYGLRVRRI